MMAQKILKDLGYDDVELSLVFTDDKSIQRLNKQWRSKDRATDVLSFPMVDDNLPEVQLEENALLQMLGDVVISYETALRQSKELKSSFQEEICRLLVHGILHLVGYDHEENDEKKSIMEAKERELIALLLEDKDVIISK